MRRCMPAHAQPRRRHEQLADGRLALIFSVDLFSRGVDLPTIDTVMMLRPAGSKILFYAAARARPANGRQDKLVVLDFIGSHHGFLQTSGTAGPSAPATASSRPSRARSSAASWRCPTAASSITICSSSISSSRSTATA